MMPGTRSVLLALLGFGAAALLVAAPVATVLQLLFTDAPGTEAGWATSSPTNGTLESSADADTAGQALWLLQWNGGAYLLSALFLGLSVRDRRLARSRALHLCLKFVGAAVVGPLVVVALVPFLLFGGPALLYQFVAALPFAAACAMLYALGQRVGVLDVKPAPSSHSPRPDS